MGSQRAWLNFCSHLHQTIQFLYNWSRTVDLHLLVISVLELLPFAILSKMTASFLISPEFNQVLARAKGCRLTHDWNFLTSYQLELRGWNFLPIYLIFIHVFLIQNTFSTFFLKLEISFRKVDDLKSCPRMVFR